MLKTKKILLYLFILFSVFFMYKGNLNAELLDDKDYVPYNPNYMPCIANNTCVLVCGYGNTPVNNNSGQNEFGIYIVYDMIDYQWRYGVTHVSGNLEIIGPYQRIIDLLDRFKEGSTVVGGTIGEYYKKYFGAGSGPLLVNTIEDTGKCPEKGFVNTSDLRGISSLGYICLENSSQPICGSITSDDAFTGPANLKYSLLDATKSDNSSVKDAVKRHYDELNLFTCDKLYKYPLTISKKYESYDTMGLPIGKVISAEIVGDGMIDGVYTASDDYMVPLDENIYGVKALDASMSKILAYSGVNLENPNQRGSDYRALPPRDSGYPQMFSAISDQIAKAAELYLRPDEDEPGNGDCKITKTTVSPIYSEDYIVPGTCDSPYIKAAKKCVINLLKEIDAMRDRGEISDEVAEDLHDQAEDLENRIEDIFGTALVPLDFDFATWENLNCAQIVGDNVIAFFNLAYMIIKIGAPVLLTVLSMMDFMKATAEGEDEMKTATKKLIKRAIIVVIIFVLPTFIRMIGTLTGLDTTCITF